MTLEITGIQAVFEDKDFQAGIARYNKLQRDAATATEQATKAIGVSWDNAAQRFRDSSNKFVSVAEVSRRLEELRAKFPPVEEELGKTERGLTNVGSAGQTAGRGLSFLGNTISTALGTAVGFLTAQVIPQILRAVQSFASLQSLRTWGGQIDELSDIFGLGAEDATGFAIALNQMGISVDEGMSGFQYFSRQVATTKDQLTDAADKFGESTAQIASDYADALNRISTSAREAQQEAADNIAGVWQEFADKRAEIEAGLADQLANIQEGLNERLADLADQRAKLEANTAKSLSKLEDDTRERLRNSRTARERRQIRKDAAERKQEILAEAAERRAELDKQEAREREHAAKQMAQAERVAQKQIEAAEKAAQKQTEAIEKGLTKQEKAFARQAEEAGKAYAKAMAAASKAVTEGQVKSPLARALDQLGLKFDAIADDSRPFTERLGDIMDAFAKLPEGVDASGLALQLFGRQGLTWLDFLRQGRKGLEDAKKLGIDLGVVLNPDEIKEFNRGLREVDQAFGYMAVTLQKELMPIIAPVVKQFREFMLTIAIPKMRGYIDRIISAFKKGGIKGAFDEVWKILTEPEGLFAQLSRLFQNVKTWITEGDGKTLLTAAGSGIGALIDGLRAWVSSPEGQQKVAGATQAITNAVGAGLQTALQTAVWVSGVMLELTGRLTEWVASEEGQKAISDLAKLLAGAVVSGITSFFGMQDKSGEHPLKVLLSNLWWSGYRLLESWASIGASIAAGIIGGIVRFFLGNEAANRVETSIRGTLTKVLLMMMSPGSVIVAAFANFANVLWNAFISRWQQLTAGWNPFGWFGSNTNNGSYVNVTGRAKGGYIPINELAMLHAGEYVLNRQQTRALAPVLNTMNTRTTYQFNNTWHGSPSSFNRRDVERTAEDAAYRGIARALGKG